MSDQFVESVRKLLAEHDATAESMMRPSTSVDIPADMQWVIDDQKALLASQAAALAKAIKERDTALAAQKKAEQVAADATAEAKAAREKAARDAANVVAVTKENAALAAKLSSAEASASELKNWADTFRADVETQTARADDAERRLSELREKLEALTKG